MISSTKPMFVADQASRTVEEDNCAVPIVPRGLVDQRKVRAGVLRAQRARAPDVIRIMYSFTDDWRREDSFILQSHYF